MRKNLIKFSYKRLFRLNLFIVVLFITVGCSNQQGVGTQIANPTVEAPTVHRIFASPIGATETEREEIPLEEGTPTIVPMFEQSLLPTPSNMIEQFDEITPMLTPTPRPTIVAEALSIFDDELNENWTVENSFFGEYDLEEDEVSYNGRYSATFLPATGFANFIFSVSPEADRVYLRQDVLAVRFWLYSGDDYIATDDLLVSIVGSNQYSYWVDGDNSVETSDERPTFPSTRLYFLNVDEDIPPDTWIQIEVWLNELIYDPVYEYVTGIIIKNDEDLLRTIYIDDLEMIVKND
jgi:hypothetical protein